MISHAIRICYIAQMGNSYIADLGKNASHGNGKPITGVAGFVVSHGCGMEVKVFVVFGLCGMVLL